MMFHVFALSQERLKAEGKRVSSWCRSEYRICGSIWESNFPNENNSVCVFDISHMIREKNTIVIVTNRDKQMQVP